MNPGGITNSRSCVLDASALLAMLHGEPGAEIVEDLIASSAISSVNWSEVIQKALERQTDVRGLREDLESLGLEIAPFTAELAESTAHLRSQTRHAGLSLGDRSCLALARFLDLPVLTADRIWNELTIGIEIRVVR